MSEAPERVYMDPDIQFPACEKQYGCDVEYVRADLYAELETKLEKAMGQFRKLHRRQDCLEAFDAVVNDIVEEALAELTGENDD